MKTKRKKKYPSVLLRDKSDYGERVLNIASKLTEFYHDDAIKEQWNSVLDDAKIFQQVNFSTENDDVIQNGKVIDIGKHRFLVEPCQAAGDWENPVLYFRCQLKDGYIDGLNGDKLFVYIPFDGNSNLYEKDGSFYTTENSETDGEEIKKSKCFDELTDFLKNMVENGDYNNARVRKIAKRLFAYSVNLKDRKVDIDEGKEEPYEKDGIKILTRKALDKLIESNKQGKKYYKGVNLDILLAVLEFDPVKTGGLETMVVKSNGDRTYKYSEEHLERKSKIKYKRIVGMDSVYSDMISKVDRDLKGGNDRLKQIASVVKLIDLSKMRIGTNEGEKKTGNLGATTLKVENIIVKGNTVKLDFVGKSGVKWKKSIKSSALAKNIEKFSEGKSSDDKVFSVSDKMVNDYLREFSVTAKDFRTYHGTRLAFELLRDNPPPISCETPQQSKSCLKAAKSIIKRVVEAVSDALGNTPSVALNKYINPTVISSYLDGQLRFAGNCDETFSQILGEIEYEMG